MGAGKISETKADNPSLLKQVNKTQRGMVTCPRSNSKLVAEELMSTQGELLPNRIGPFAAPATR